MRAQYSPELCIVPMIIYDLRWILSVINYKIMWIWFDPAPAADGFSKLQGVGCCAKATATKAEWDEEDGGIGGWKM